PRSFQESVFDSTCETSRDDKNEPPDVRTTRRAAAPASVTPGARSLARRRGAVGKRDEEREAILCADRARDVTLTCRVLGQQDVPGTKPKFSSALELDFALAAQRDDELASRSGVPIEVVVLVGSTELEVLHLDRL